MAMTGRTGARLRLRVTPAAESKIRAGHPWVFAQSIREQNRAGEPGEIGVVYDRKDRFLALGLYDPESPIRLRVLHTGDPVQINANWWEERLQAALGRRAGLFDAQTTGYRCINGESDGWPGLVVDRYGGTHVIKVYTAAWLPRLNEIAALLGRVLVPERLVLRLSRNIRDAAAGIGFEDGQVLHGPTLDSPVVFLESGLRFESDVVKGQKTGFFLDQRENRRRVGELARGRKVLNAFSFSGGFSLYAARGGAVAVTDLDISKYALAASKRNFALNAAIPSVARCAHELVQADVFEWFGGPVHEEFGLIVVDPPSLAKREAEKPAALAAYGRLASAAMMRLSPGGILVACSCSAHVGAEEFFEVIRRSAAKSGRRFREFERTFHAPDHAATFPEAEYLKAVYLEMTKNPHP